MSAKQNPPAGQRTLYTVSLSDEELWALLEYLQVPSHTAADFHKLQTYAENVRRALLEAGKRALWARGMIRYLTDEQEVRIQNRVLHLVRQGIRPARVYYFERQYPDRSVERIYVYGRGEHWVLHTYPVPGIHQLMHIPRPEYLLQVVGTALNLSAYPQAPDFPKATLPDEALQACWDHLRHQDEPDEAHLHRILSEQGLPQPLATAFAHSLKDFTSYNLLSRWDEHGDTRTQFAVLQAPDTLWMLATDGRHVHFRPLTGEDMFHILQKFFAST